jgi:hypothetical protein
MNANRLSRVLFNNIACSAKDVCESVCEACVLVHGGRLCRACHLCVCAQRECVCSRATISRGIWLFVTNVKGTFFGMSES